MYMAKAYLKKQQQDGNFVFLFMFELLGGFMFSVLKYLVTRVSLNLPHIMKAKETAVKSLTFGVAHLFKRNRITHIRGKIILSI